MPITESRLKANRKWREKNLQSIVDKARERYQTDKEYRDHIKAYNLGRYHAKKELLSLANISIEIFIE